MIGVIISTVACAAVISLTIFNGATGSSTKKCDENKNNKKKPNTCNNKEKNSSKTDKSKQKPKCSKQSSNSSSDFSSSESSSQSDSSSDEERSKKCENLNKPDKIEKQNKSKGCGLLTKPSTNDTCTRPKVRHERRSKTEFQSERGVSPHGDVIYEKRKGMAEKSLSTNGKIDYRTSYYEESYKDNNEFKVHQKEVEQYFDKPRH